MAYHCLLRLKNNGNCTELKGRVLLYDVFVDEPQCSWDENEILFQRKERKRIADYLKAEALKDSVQLDFFQMEKRIHITEEVTHYKGAKMCLDTLAKQNGYTSMKEYYLYLKNRYPVDQILFSFLFDKKGRSFAYADDTPGYGLCESLFLFDSDGYTMLHELLHLFGAVDYYYPREVAKMAHQYFKNSVMLASNQYGIDELTRYLIGWHAKPTALAKSVLDAAASITKEEFQKSISEQWEAAYTVIEYSNSVYYGSIKNGMRHGKGKIVFHEGTVYEGEFLNGNYHGQGKVTFKSGTVYEGGFFEGEYHGWGEFIYRSGQVEQCCHEKGKRIK